MFVLATTDPQKVIPTIRSRTQHFEFHLLPAAPLEEYVRHVVDAAGLDVTPEAIDHAVRAGNGSARDALSALEQVVAAGGVAEREISVDELIEGLIERDSGRVLVAVADAVNVGRDPRLLGQQLVIRLRDVFLGAMKAPLDHLADADRERVDVLVERFDRPFITRCIEVLGDALAAMVDAVDQRIVLEAALIRLASLEVDNSPAALLERIERLERALASGRYACPGDRSTGFRVHADPQERRSCGRRSPSHHTDGGPSEPRRPHAGLGRRVAQQDPARRQSALQHGPLRRGR